jgi:dTDP-4-dehydrorhamnose reductase
MREFMKILILGGSGMLGHRLWLELSKNHETAATIRGESPFKDFKSYQIDNILDFSRLEEIIKDFRPNIVINCIGLIKQDKNHDSAILNIELNAVLPHKVSKLCERYNSRLILFSTDCVFSGKKGNYTEEDFCDADDVYGRSKKLGEVEGQKHVLTLRTSIIGLELRGKASLVEWFLSQENQQVKGFKKAVFSGFPTKTIAHILQKYVLQDPTLSGLYHLSADPVNKFDLVTLIKNQVNLKVEILPFEDFEIDRSLDSSKFRNKTNFSPLPWKELVKDIFVNDISYQR